MVGIPETGNSKNDEPSFTENLYYHSSFCDGTLAQAYFGL
jgi:hypothetical protein